jgi:dipeptidyl aminopeptidase/acylaminoacyl peptidase
MGNPEKSSSGTQQKAKQMGQHKPISHIDKVERPLFVLHGTEDVNVPFLESVWPSTKL